MDKNDSASARQPATLSRAFDTIADHFEAIRREWVESDREQLSLLAAGFSSETSGYSTIMREEVRAKVTAAYATLRDGIPAVLPHCDPSLRDSIQRLARQLDLNAIFPDACGEPTERWRHTSPATNLDADIDELVPKLRAAAERARIEAVPHLLATPLAADRAVVTDVTRGPASWQARPRKSDPPPIRPAAVQQMVDTLFTVIDETRYIAEIVAELLPRVETLGFPHNFSWGDLPPVEDDPDRRNMIMGERERAAAKAPNGLSWWIGRRDRHCDLREPPLGPRRG